MNNYLFQFSALKDVSTRNNSELPIIQWTSWSPIMVSFFWCIGFWSRITGQICDAGDHEYQSNQKDWYKCSTNQLATGLFKEFLALWHLFSLQNLKSMSSLKYYSLVKMIFRNKYLLRIAMTTLSFYELYYLRDMIFG